MRGHRTKTEQMAKPRNMQDSTKGQNQLRFCCVSIVLTLTIRFLVACSTLATVMVLEATAPALCLTCINAHSVKYSEHESQF